MVRRLEAVGLASGTHTEALALLACHMEEVERFDKILNEVVTVGGEQQNNYVYKTNTATGAVILKENPVVRLRDKAARRVHSLLTEFGLTPASSQKIGAKKQLKGKNEFDGF